MIRPLIVLAALACMVASAAAQSATDPTPDDLAFFEAQVRPLLSDRCYECHGEKKPKGGLRLDSRPGWMAGGDTGRVIVPGEPGLSPLIAAIGYKDEDLQMPPKEPLTAAEVAVLTEWVRRGAPDPRHAVPAPTGRAIVAMSFEQARAHWAFQPIVAKRAYLDVFLQMFPHVLPLLFLL